MIDYLIKSTICLTVFLAFYHLILEREKMHQFNRFYLLFSIVISLIIPFITFEIIKIIPVVQNFEPEITNTILTTPKENVIQENINYIPYTLCAIYVLISFLLLVRFSKNVWKLISKSKNNPIVKHENAKLVLIDDKTLPHTFLNFIFINFEDYNNRNIEEELYSHELVHVNQKHTLDILFIEFLKVFFWFNPILFFYKNAIQLNHEFLADEEIVKTYNNVPFYQNLLLQKSSGNQTIYLASNLNYLVTKKRLIMMTKSTSQRIAIIKKIAVLPIVVILFMLFCIETIAKEKKVFISNTKKEIVLKTVEKQLEKPITQDTVKKKIINVIEPKKTEIVKINNINYKKINDVYFNEKGSIDIKGNKLEEGYIIINNETCFYSTNEEGKIEYYSRWGFRVNEKGEKLTQDDVKALTELTEKPDYEGGLKEFFKYISSNFIVPNEFSKQKQKGTLYTKFIIEKDGSLSNIKVINDLGFGTKEEAIRILQKSPKWKSGKINDQDVRCSYTLPISIQSE